MIHEAYSITVHYEVTTVVHIICNRSWPDVCKKKLGFFILRFPNVQTKMKVSGAHHNMSG